MYEQKLIDILKETKEVMQLEELAKLMYCSISTVKRSKDKANKTKLSQIKTKHGRKGGYYI
ncbi:HTH domain protein [Clostridiales bacterium oral taxon 876 str. F0540]|nr:HTH domain protein [Clostridiales bacterium oral taxon 876 str. F0540]